MIRPIITSKSIFAKPAVAATIDDAPTAQDLLDTLAAHRDECVGMAANMIGSPVSIIAFAQGGAERALFNPRIISSSGPYQAEESCLSLAGSRPATRYRCITVTYQELVGDRLVDRRAMFTGFTAQVIQHEVDHTRGIVI